jgi:cardiolipin synthase
VEAFAAASRRGVRVRILMPGEHMDQPAVRRASKKRWPELIEAGVELYEYKPTMIHTKLLIADGRFVSIGSANFDPRSLRINDEANLNVLDPAFAREQTQVFERDLRQADRVELDDAHNVAEKPLQAVQTPLEPQL